MTADVTPTRVAQLTLKEIHDEALVSSQIIFPGLDGIFFVVLSIAIAIFYVRFFFDSIQVLVNPIQKEGKEFLCIVLIRAAELGSKLAQLLLELHRFYHRFVV